jgi:hypothetical protein
MLYNVEKKERIKMGLYTEKIYEAFGLVEKEKNVFYGVYRGYELTLAVNQQFFVHLNFFADGNVKAQAVRVFHTASNQTMTNVGVSIYGLAATVNGMTANSALKKLTEKLDATIAYLNANEAKGVGYCPCCGEECDLLKTIRVNDVYVSLDDKCYNEVAKVAEVEEQHYNAQPNNYLKGFLGAILGAGIGAVAWIVLYYLGFLSALTAVLAVFLGNYFYVKFGGKANNVKNIIVAAVSLVVLVLACVGIYYVEVGSVIAANNLNMTPFELIFSDEELKGYFISDMAMNVIFTIIGVVAQIASTKRNDQSSRTRVSQ